MGTGNKFEYKRIEIRYDHERCLQLLEALSIDGWELVSIVPSGLTDSILLNGFAYLKRPNPNYQPSMVAETNVEPSLE